MTQADEDIDSKTVIGARADSAQFATARMPSRFSAENLVGTVFAQKYEILELLGKGGMSVVYRARHIVMNKMHAVKILHMHLVTDETTLRRFTQEAQAASNLNHPGIVTVHDCGEGDGMPYLVMDYIEGRSLADLLKSQGRLDAVQFLSIMLQVTAALAHAHEAGVVHRDLKPSNLMIAGQKQQVKIVDFGIAKLVSESEEEARLTQTGDVFGSPHYMSPEQSSGAPVDRRSDIYALGCVMYELLAGKPPQQGTNALDIMYKHVNVPPPALPAEQLDDDMKQKLELILLRCLAKLPAERYQDVREIESELRSLSLKSKSGIFRALGGAWDLAAAKRRAARKSRTPLLVLIMAASIISACVLASGLHNADRAMERLDHSRLIVEKVADTETAFVLLAQRTRKYYYRLIFHPDQVAERKVAFDAASDRLSRCLDQVDQILKDDSSWTPMRKKLKEKLGEAPNAAMVSAKQLDAASQAGLALSTQSMAAAMRLSAICDEGEKVLSEMSTKARVLENKELLSFEQSQLWIRNVSTFCAVLNAAVIFGLVAYVARGTPERLRKLAVDAAALSRRRGLKQPAEEPARKQDEHCDLDNVLQDLVVALSEAEEREQLLLRKLREQEGAGRDQGASGPAARETDSQKQALKSSE